MSAMVPAYILAFLGGLGGGEIVLILAVLLLFFGAKKIPGLARGLGQGLSEFRQASQSLRDELQAPPPPAKTSTPEA